MRKYNILSLAEHNGLSYPTNKYNTVTAAHSYICAYIIYCTGKRQMAAYCTSALSISYIIRALSSRRRDRLQIIVYRPRHQPRVGDHEMYITTTRACCAVDRLAFKSTKCL